VNAQLASHGNHFALQERELLLSESGEYGGIKKLKKEVCLGLESG
jgi:hypothetical protein